MFDNDSEADVEINDYNGEYEEENDGPINYGHEDWEIDPDMGGIIKWILKSHKFHLLANSI